MTAALKGIVAVWAYILLIAFLPDAAMPSLFILCVTALGAVLGLMFFKR